jgi:putative AdoMet-dependent methyltransferase
MTRTAEETRALFDRWAATYDEDLHDPRGPLEGYDASLQTALTMLSLPHGAQVLDIGIGTGAFSALMAMQYNVRITGVDPSPMMLEKCAAVHPTFELYEGSFNSLPVTDGAFDAVISSFAFHEVLPRDRAQACMEIGRVLKPGGFVGLLDIMFASDAAQGDARRMAAQLWDDTEDYARVGTLDELLRGAGFGGLQWRQSAPCHWIVVARKS